MRSHCPDSVTSILGYAFDGDVEINGYPVVLTQSPGTVSYSLDENTDPGVIANLETDDPDIRFKHSYSLVDGNGSDDNRLFEVVGDQLKIIDAPNFETKPSYSLRLQTTFSNGLTYSKPIILEVNDINESPTSSPISKSESIQKLQSINDITAQIEVTTFQLTKSVRLHNQEVEMLILGTDKKDKITGSSEGEILSGVYGKDVLKGGDGADGFLFLNAEELL